MSARALHKLAPPADGDGMDMRRAICGTLDLRARGLAAADMTESSVEVTCRLCVRRLNRAQVEAAVRVAEVVLGAPHPGAHASKPLPMSREMHAIIERSRRGEVADVGPRWSSLDRALEHESRVVLDGAPVRSSSDPDRYGARPQRSVGDVPVPQAVAGREDVLAVRVAIVRGAIACVEAMELGQIGIGANLTAADFELVLRWLVQGEPVWSRIAPHRKGGMWKAMPRTRDDVAAELSRRHKREVTERQVEIAQRAMRQAVEEALRATGELRVRRPRAKREEAAMAVPGFELEGWKQIADHVGRSIDWCQKRAAREADPMPVGDLDGRKVANIAELDAWVAQEVARSRAAPAA